MTPQSADVVIIGAGSTGLSAAYELAKAGARPLVIEKGFLAGEQGGRNPGGIRQIGRDANEVALMTAAMHRWHGLAEELNQDIELTQDGYLWVALDEGELQLLRAMVERDIPFGIEEHLLDRSQLDNLAPGFSPMAIGAIYSPTDCIANPFLVAKGYYDNGRRLGARYLFGTEVVGIRADGGKVRAVVTNQGEIATDTLVIAAGPWSGKVGQMVGLEIPITPCPNQFIVTERAPQVLPPFLMISSIAVCRQSRSGQLFIGNLNAPTGIIGYDKQTHYGELDRATASLLRLVPGFARLNAIRTWAGTLDFTPDDTFIFGQVDNIGGLILACGYSGHGFALTPVMGQLIRELILDGQTSLPTHAFRFDRFAHPEETSEGLHFTHQHVGDS